MLLLEIKNTTTRLSGLDRAQHKLLSDHLSYEVDGAAFAMRALPKGAWDGRKRLLARDGSFPAGLTLEVGKWLKEQGLRPEIVDLRNRAKLTPVKLEMRPGLEPRPFQTQSCEITDTSPRGIFVIGTGGGKSITAAMITARRKVPTLFVTPDKGLKVQTLAVFRHWLGEKAVGEKVKSDAPIVVTNIHQIDRCEAKDLERFQMLLIDEFHHSAAVAYLRLNMFASNCFYRYGFTGTPLRTDGRDMVMNGVLSNVLLRKTTSDLINDGYLVPPFIHFIRHKLKGYSKYNYKDAYEAITSDQAFNARVAQVIREKAFSERLQTIVLVRRVEHGQLLKSMLSDEAVFVSGLDSIEEREQIKAAFAKKKIRCMIATSIFGEGQDIPSIDCLVNVRLQESEIQTKQGVGRALRLAYGAKTFEDSVQRGKSKAEVFDFMIEGNKHLRRHSESRITQYRSEPRFTVTIDD